MAWDTTKIDGNVVEPVDWNDQVDEIKDLVNGVGTPASFVDLDTTPSVSVGRHFKTANTGATSITTFDDGTNGKEITIIGGDALTTFVDGATLKLNAGSDLIIGQYDVIKFILDVTVWLCTSYQQNTV